MPPGGAGQAPRTHSPPVSLVSTSQTGLVGRPADCVMSTSKSDDHVDSAGQSEPVTARSSSVGVDRCLADGVTEDGDGVLPREVSTAAEAVRRHSDVHSASLSASLSDISSIHDDDDDVIVISSSSPDDVDD